MSIGMRLCVHPVSLFYILHYLKDDPFSIPQFIITKYISIPPPLTFPSILPTFLQSLT